jgi:isopentenyldiphosphate isomerase
MAYLDHIARCNTFDLTGFRPWFIGETQAGWMRHAFAERLRAFPEMMVVTESRVWLAPDLTTPAARAQQLAAIGAELAAAGELPRARGELFPVLPRWGGAPLASLDRAWVTYFGLPAYGVHLNGSVTAADGTGQMWIARRALGKMTYPGQLDNLVAGGQPVGLGLFENMVKECGEEADIPPTLASNMRAAGQITYAMEVKDGLKQDTLYLYDLELPADFQPNNTDGEVDSFLLMPLAEVAGIVRETFNFKFNCNLVVIDYLLRHGFLTPDGEPEYGALCTGLHAKFPIAGSES